MESKRNRLRYRVHTGGFHMGGEMGEGDEEVQTLL